MDYSPIMRNIIIFGASYLIWIELIFVAVLYMHAHKKDKNHIHKIALVLVPLTYIVAYIASMLYNNPRPFVAENFNPLVYHGTDNGFPSDHTLLASLVAILFISYKKNITYILWIGAVLIGISRVYAGVHHPVDIFGALIITTLCGYVSFKYIKKPAQ